ncbi:MAG: hypothetical protein KF802_02465 [Bdellovibrionaceae bacterium]|nr:hypothetical protein [Pseudobdellovibrionaceae bacterium]
MEIAVNRPLQDWIGKLSNNNLVSSFRNKIKRKTVVEEIKEPPVDNNYESHLQRTNRNEILMEEILKTSA